jgi:hypothetical protein
VGVHRGLNYRRQGGIFAPWQYDLVQRDVVDASQMELADGWHDEWLVAVSVTEPV